MNSLPYSASDSFRDEALQIVMMYTSAIHLSLWCVYVYWRRSVHSLQDSVLTFASSAHRCNMYSDCSCKVCKCFSPRLSHWLSSRSRQDASVDERWKQQGQRRRWGKEGKRKWRSSVQRQSWTLLLAGSAVFQHPVYSCHHQWTSLRHTLALWWVPVFWVFFVFF